MKKLFVIFMMGMSLWTACGGICHAVVRPASFDEMVAVKEAQAGNKTKQDKQRLQNVLAELENDIARLQKHLQAIRNELNEGNIGGPK